MTLIVSRVLITHIAVATYAHVTVATYARVTVATYARVTVISLSSEGIAKS